MKEFLIEFFLELAEELITDALAGRLGNRPAPAEKTRPHPQDDPWKCVCGRENSGHLDYCTFCRRDRSEGFTAFTNARTPGEQAFFQALPSYEEETSGITKEV